MLYEAHESRDLLQWKVDYVLSSDAGQVIHLLDKNLRMGGLERALDMIYSNNGIEFPRPPSDSPLPVYIGPQPLTGQSTMNPGGELRKWAETKIGSPLHKEEINSLIQSLTNESEAANAAFSHCRQVGFLDKAFCFWQLEDQQHSNALAHVLVEDFMSCVQAFDETGTLGTVKK